MSHMDESCTYEEGPSHMNTLYTYEILGGAGVFAE